MPERQAFQRHIGSSRINSSSIFVFRASVTEKHLGGLKMNKRFLLLALLISLCIVSLSSVTAGEQSGKGKMLEVDIEFLAPIGTAVADSTGMTYWIEGEGFHSDIVYAEEYWGEYPLYLPGGDVPIRITVTDRKSHGKAKSKLVVKTQCFRMNLDGSNGEVLIIPQTINIELARGETRTIDTILPLSAGEKLLNRVLVEIYNKKRKKLIMTREGIFCPPELE